MSGTGCVEFLKWALPKLGLAWPGFRRVRHQVCKRIARRLGELGLGDPADYRQFLDSHPEEWKRLESFCRISISRFYRDREAFDFLGNKVLTELAGRCAAERRSELRACSLGCASGEEPYTLSLLWRFRVEPNYPSLSLRVLGCDADETLLQRARSGSYGKSSFRELPPEWVRAAFERRGSEYVLKDAFREGVEFRRSDIRRNIPSGPFDLILCRYLAFTYSDPESQRQTLDSVAGELRPGGAVMIGRKESLPADADAVEPWKPALGIYRK